MGLHEPPPGRSRPPARRGRDPHGQNAGTLAARNSGELTTVHLGTEQIVQQKVSFPGGGPSQTPGVIVMRIDDTVGPDVDSALKGLVVVFNASDEATIQTLAATAAQRYELHSVQANGSDPVVKTALHNGETGQFTVPARTVAVFAQR